ncbi:MAG: hypothetical protein QM758_04030 [Armatimonas sp.]
MKHGMCGKEVFSGFRVIVDEDNDFTLSFVYSPVAGFGGAAVGVGDSSEGEWNSDSLEPFARAIGRAIVYYDDLEVRVGVGLLSQRIQGNFQTCAPVVGGDDHGEHHAARLTGVRVSRGAAGLPTTVVLAATSLLTTAPAPTVAPSPMAVQSTRQRAPRVTLSPIVTIAAPSVLRASQHALVHGEIRSGTHATTEDSVAEVPDGQPRPYFTGKRQLYPGQQTRSWIDEHVVESQGKLAKASREFLQRLAYPEYDNCPEGGVLIGGYQYFPYVQALGAGIGEQVGF